MPDETLFFYPSKQSVTGAFSTPTAAEPVTCKEAEPFALRVLDDSMQPEFRKGCIIVIDPTGRATNGSYVLVDTADGGYVFRQLAEHQGGYQLRALNDQYPVIETADDLSQLVGVIVQRAGGRRSYHKHY